ncbi:MAG: hypothetical protein RMK89_12895 [Armatimonadota bacterium]|nr:hypothetical protein [Armatimonadota bacterium]MDW8144345.1 hypothetical protein [Armatimonadota bacterium]
MANLQGWLMETQKWWQELTTSQREAFILAAVFVGTLIVGKVIGAIVKSLAKGFGLDEILRLPWSQTSSKVAKTSSDAIGYLCVATVWAAVIWWLSVRHQLTEIANATRFATGRLWMLAVMLGLSIGLSNWLVKLLTDFLKSQSVRELAEKLALQTREQLSDFIVRAFSFLVHGFVFLFVLMIATEIFGMVTTASAIRAIWDLSLRLIIAAIALGVGWLGVRWLERWVEFPEVEQTPTNLVRFLTRLGIMGVSLLLVLILLTGGAGALTALLFIAILAFILAPLREYIPDLWAGWMLKLHNVQQVTLDGELMQLRKIGVLASELSSDKSEVVKPNREILEGFLRRSEEATFREIESSKNEFGAR